MSNLLPLQDLGGREIEVPSFKRIELGDYMPVDEWRDCCESGGFIDYDGFGKLANDLYVSDIVIRPSQYEMILPAWASHIIWYNR